MSDSIEKETTFTPGPWKAEKVYGWGGVFCITAGSSYPLFIAVKPKNYYTDYVKSDDGASILSDERAAAAGRHVATLELRAELDDIEQANACLIAAATELYESIADTYLHLLRFAPEPWRTTQGQPILVSLRDALAKAAGVDPEVIQNRFEAKARGEDRSHEGK